MWENPVGRVGPVTLTHHSPARMESVARVLALALIMDAIYQLIVLRWFYPGEALLVGILLAIVPYILIRGPVTRIASPARPNGGI